MTSLSDILREEDKPEPIQPKQRPEVEETITPSGLTIRYDDRKHRYWVNDKPVDSVSAIIGVIDKSGPLMWWAQGIGIGSALHLIATDPILAATALGAPDVYEWLSAGAKLDKAPVAVRNIIDALTPNKISCNHVRDKAGVRGTTVHDALERWATDGTLPDPEFYAEGQQGFVRGLRLFIEEAAIRPTHTEVIVASAEYRFAGRYDLQAILDECEFCTHIDTKKGTEQRGVVAPGSYRIDLKTTSGVYLEAFLQMEGYEGAAIESGYPATDGRAVLRVTEDGRYELRLSNATYADFLAVRSAHAAMRALKERAA